MAWLQVHQELGRHPKLKRLARALDISAPAAVGHLLYLWWWALDYAQDGEIGQFSTDEIAEAALWPGDSNAFLAALTNCGFVDQGASDQRKIHDWVDYAGALMDRLSTQREQARIRQQRYRERQREESSNASVTRDVTGRNAPREDKRREEKSTQEESKESADKPRRFIPPTVDEVSIYCRERSNGVDPSRFVDFYSAKNWRIGKDRMTDWKAAVRTWERRVEQEPGGKNAINQRDYTTIPDGYAGF